MKKYSYKTPLGNITIQEKDNKISAVSFCDVEGEMVETPLIKRAYTQLCEYFARKRRVFNLPLLLEGTEFQIKVWTALQKIEYGKTLSYRDVAEIIGSPRASRAVGNANNKNKIAIIIPCHRVIGSNGSLTGYAGGLSVKKFLLNLEKQD